MRILVPYQTHSGIGFDSAVISGGIEKFTRSAVQALRSKGHEVLVMDYSPDSSYTVVRKQLKEAVDSFNPDVAFVNRISSTLIDYLGSMVKLRVVMHSIPAGPSTPGTYKSLEDVANSTYGKVACVSEWHKKALRHGIGSDVLMTVLFSDFATNRFIPNLVRDYAATIGRSHGDKDPLHATKLSPTIEAKVYTTVTDHDPYAPKYLKDYDDKAKSHMVLNLPHTEVLSNLAKANIYIGTAKIETFGITALEAMSAGVPVVQFSKKTGGELTHAVSEIDPSVLVLAKKSTISKDDIQRIKEFVESWDDEQRSALAKRVSEKYSFENFSNVINEFVN